MKVILIILNIAALGSAFTSLSTLGRRPTASNGLGNRFKKLIGRKEDNNVVVLDVPDVSGVDDVEAMKPPDPEKEKSETENLMQQVKDSGVAGVISYAQWELGFWTVSLPVCIFGYRELTGYWPDFSNPEDMEKVGAEAFAIVNFARFAVPQRIGLALSTTPWIQANIVDKYLKKEQETETTKETNDIDDPTSSN